MIYLHLIFLLLFSTAFAQTQQDIDVDSVVVKKINENTFLTTVQLKDGATVEIKLGSDPIGTGGKACRGWYNKFAVYTVKGFTGLISDASVIVSGSFHNDGGIPSFPVKTKAWIATYGDQCSKSHGANNMRMLSVRATEKRAYVEKFDLTKFNSTTSAPHIIVGLDPTFNKDANTKKGRHFIGLKTPYNGGFGTLVSVVSKKMTSKEAIDLLIGQGCTEEQIIQFDGSTVAQISEKQDGKWMHHITPPPTDERKMPCVIVINKKLVVDDVWLHDRDQSVENWLQNQD